MLEKGESSMMNYSRSSEGWETFCENMVNGSEPLVSTKLTGRRRALVI